MVLPFRAPTPPSNLFPWTFGCRPWQAWPPSHPSANSRGGMCYRKPATPPPSILHWASPTRGWRWPRWHSWQMPPPPPPRASTSYPSAQTPVMPLLNSAPSSMAPSPSLPPGWCACGARGMGARLVRRGPCARGAWSSTHCPATGAPCPPPLPRRWCPAPPLGQHRGARGGPAFNPPAWGPMGVGWGIGGRGAQGATWGTFPVGGGV